MRDVKPGERAGSGRKEASKPKGMEHQQMACSDGVGGGSKTDGHDEAAMQRSKARSKAGRREEREMNRLGQ